MIEGGGLAAFAHEVLLDQAFGDDDMGETVDEGHVGARPELQVIIGRDVRCAHQIDGPRIGHDEVRPRPQPPLHLRGEHRMSVGGVRADHENHIRLHHRVEVLSPRGLTQSLFEAIPGRGMAHPRAGVDVVVAEAGTHEFLDQVGFLVRAAGGGDAADGVASILGLDSLQLACRVADRLFPRHLAPRVGDLGADHRLDDAIRMRRIADRKAALHAGVTVIGMTILVRHHAHHFLALHLGAERTAHPAVGAGRHQAVLGLTLLDQRIFGQRCGRAGLHAGAAGDALGVHEGNVLARRYARTETATLNRERQRALLLVAGANAARTDDALARIEGEIGVTRVLLGGEMIFAFIAVAHFAQAHDAGHVLQLAMPVRGAGEAIQGMVGDVQLHPPAPHIGDLLVLGRDLHALRRRRGAGGGQALRAFDLHQAEAAGAERFQLIGGAELGDLGT